MLADDSTARLQTRLQELLARVRGETRIPGIAIGISVQGRRVTAHAGTRAVGEQLPLASDSRYQLGCAAKLSQAMRALELARRGVLDPEAAIGEHLPELRGSHAGQAIKVAHLLSHTSGYRGTNILDARVRSLDWDGLVGYLRHCPQLFEPGSVFSYEHTESVLLGEIVRRIAASKSPEDSGGTAEPELSRRAAEPATAEADRDAGQHRFDEREGRFVRLEPHDAIPPFWQSAFSERTVTIDDLLALGEGALAVPELQRSVVRLPATIGGPLRELLPVAYGLGSAELRDDFRGNTGVSAGQCLGLRFRASTRVCVAVALNAIVPYLRDFVLAALCRDFASTPVRPDVERFDFELADLTGFYIGPGAAMAHVRLIGERLVCTLGRENRPEKLDVDLVLDDDGRPVLRSPIPHLSLGFFRAANDGPLGLMLGLSAYKRIAQ